MGSPYSIAPNWQIVMMAKENTSGGGGEGWWQKYRNTEAFAETFELSRRTKHHPSPQFCWRETGGMSLMVARHLGVHGSCRMKADTVLRCPIEFLTERPWLFSVEFQGAESVL